MDFAKDGVYITCKFNIRSDNMENENMNEEKQYEDFKRLVENTDFWNTFVHIEGSETSGKKE